MELKKEFKCVVEVNAQPIELSFRKVHVPKGCKYFVVARTLRGIASSFEIITDSEQQWHVVPPVPTWLNPLIDRLANIIAEQAGDSN